MTSPSSNPRGERSPAPGVTWNTRLISLGETIVDLDDGDSPFGWRDLPEPSRPNRETRRAARRAARRKK
ncbi:hypothetical protein ACIQCF_07405 [Streptomyces sp. NPDC088353]|uniref:hypothetical protein n=1 Tax=Streptomyces sp. NPDC088353 TaxID=3365855 RepID=UPI0037F68563